MPDSKPRVLTEEEREQTRRWLDNWRRVGPLLEAERMADVRALTDAEAADIACELWRLARPDAGDDGEGLLPMTRALQKLENR